MEEEGQTTPLLILASHLIEDGWLRRSLPRLGRRGRQRRQQRRQLVEGDEVHHAIRQLGTERAQVGRTLPEAGVRNLDPPVRTKETSSVSDLGGPWRDLGLSGKRARR